jgi:hypothetical protein
MEHRSRVTVVRAALAERAARAAMLVLAALEAVVVPGRAATVVWAWQASAALVAVAARVAPGSMRAASPTARLVVMPGLVALVERVVQRAHLARTLRRCSVVMAGPAVMLARLARARWVSAAWMEHRRRVTVDLAVLVELAVRAAIPVLAALGAVVVPGLVAAVAWAWRAVAALAAVVARAALAGMPAASPTARLVVMPGTVAKVERAALRA